MSVPPCRWLEGGTDVRISFPNSVPPCRWLEGRDLGWRCVNTRVPPCRWLEAAESLKTAEKLCATVWAA